MSPTDGRKGRLIGEVCLNGDKEAGEGSSDADMLETPEGASREALDRLGEAAAVDAGAELAALRQATLRLPAATKRRTRLGGQARETRRA